MLIRTLKITLLCISFVLALPLDAMEPINLETTEGQELSLQEPFIPANSQALLQQNKDKLNRQLSYKAWKVIFDIFAVNKFAESDPTIEVDMTEESTNPFLKNKVEHDDAKQLILLLTNYTPKESPITDKVLQAFILFTKGNIKKKEILFYWIPITMQDQDFLKKLDDSVKTALDKYCFLYFNEHFNLPKELIGYVNLQELIKVRNINSIKITKEINNCDEIKVDLKDCSLNSLEGWQDLFSSHIKPKLVCAIDLSKNNLTELSPDLLKGFANLKKISLAYNKLESLPDALFKDCEQIRHIDLTHNLLKEIPKISGYQLEAVILDQNPLNETSKALIKYQKEPVFQTDKNIQKEVAIVGILSTIFILFINMHK